MKITLRQSDVLISIEKGRRMDIAGSTTRLRLEGGGWAIDPDTGESLGKEESLAGEVMLTQVLEKMSKATVVSGTGFSKGDVVRLKE